MVGIPNARYDGKYHLLRTWYQTDATTSDSEYLGTQSGTIPGMALVDRLVVGVDWSKRGWVEVTYLLSGAGKTGDIPASPQLIDHGEACWVCGHNWVDHNRNVGCTVDWEYDKEGVATRDGCYCKLSHTDYSSNDER